jgi:type I restriction enzyme S subunit
MLLSNLNLLATAPGGVARLRELILTLAVQGKLVAQDPNDEPASELLKKIRAEKDRLIAEGKIKRDKPLAGITEEEKPFGLPVGWEWVHLNALAEQITKGTTPTTFGHSYKPEGVNFVKIENIDRGRLNLVQMTDFIATETHEIMSRSQLSAGDVLFSIAGTIGKTAVVLEADLPANTNQALAIIKGAAKHVNQQFLLLALDSFVSNKVKDKARGGAMNNISLGDLSELLITIPPLAEQSRIVTRVAELMRLCDALEVKGQLEAAQHAQLVTTLLGSLAQSDTPAQLAENWQRLATHFDLLLDRPRAVDALEQTILQLAVRGLLVPQDSTDEPASELLKKIRLEKDRLILEGKIKRDKPLVAIAAETQPFELPVGWSWARFPELGEFGRGKSKHRPRNDPALFNPPKYPLIQTGEVSRANGVVQKVHSYYSDVGLAQSRMWPKGTLCITIAANIAESAILGFDSCFPDSVVGFVPANAMGNVEYFLLFVETARADLLAFAPATAQKNINLEILSSLLIPMPPLSELTRIVTRVESLRRLCADLRQRLSASQSTQAQLAQALVQEVA